MWWVTSTRTFARDYGQPRPPAIFEEARIRVAVGSLETGCSIVHSGLRKKVCTDLGHVVICELGDEFPREGPQQGASAVTVVGLKLECCLVAARGLSLACQQLKHSQRRRRKRFQISRQEKYAHTLDHSLCTC